MKSIIIIGILLIILSSVGYFYFSGDGKNLKPIEVHVTPVQRGTFMASTLGTGKLIARRKEQLVSMISGIVIDKGKSVGQFLPKGTVVAKVRLLEPDLRKKQRDLEYALLDLGILKEQVQQSEDLIKAKAISEVEVKELKIRKYKQEKQVQDLRQEASDYLVQTSFNGMLVAKFFDNGDHISEGTTLATIVDTSSYAVEVLVGQHQILSIKLGQRVQFTSQTFQGERWGKVLEITRSANNSQSNQLGNGETEPQFRILANIETLPFDNMFLGSQIDARFIIEVKRQALFIPMEAILYRNDTTMVYILSCGLAQKRIVKPGLSNDQFIEIVDGLTPKDTVVTLGNLDIKDGDSITIDQQNYDKTKSHDKLNFFTF
ncbi:MAG: efflux RND transporter periplasmic adaptor subunit [Ignavibacteriaceae bacterium]